MRLRGLLDNLARTAPDRFEWIACVPETAAATVEFLNQRPGAKVATIRSNAPSPEAWSNGVRHGRRRDPGFSAGPPPL